MAHVILPSITVIIQRWYFLTDHIQMCCVSTLDQLGHTNYDFQRRNLLLQASHESAQVQSSLVSQVNLGKRDGFSEVVAISECPHLY